MKVEVFENPSINRDYEIIHENTEFTSVCPITGLPDFGTIIVKYIPNKSCLELKSLKYYFFEFRNKGIFYEAVTNQILDDLVDSCHPKEMEITSQWKVRGGINSVIKVAYKDNGVKL